MRNHLLQPVDLARCSHLVPAWGKPSVWRERLEAWLLEGRLRGSTYEDGEGLPPLGVGLCGFARGTDVRSYLADPTRPMLEHVLDTEPSLLLDARGIQQARADRDLHALVLLHRLVVADPADARAQMIFRIGAEAYSLLHAGWGLMGVWHEFPSRDEAAAIAGGLQVVARINDRLLAGLERKDGAAGWPASLAASLFVDLPEVLRLTPAQRRVAELALWRLDDTQIATQLELSEETVRQHWRGIYQRMDLALPAIPDALTASDKQHRGPERRRHAIDYLMKHIHEVRPALERRSASPKLTR